MYSLRSWRMWTLSFACWTLYGVLHVIGYYVLSASLHESATVWQVLLYNFAFAYPWAIASPPIFVLAWRHSFDRMQWTGAVALYGATGLALTAAVAAFLVAWGQIPTIDANRGTPLLASFVRYFYDNLPVCLAVIGIAHAAQYYGRFRERELASVRLEGRLAQARLELLRSQLEPHFLFNTLNSIAALTRKDPEGAERMTLQLSSLLRASLECNGSQLVPLQQELQFLQTYLDIQQTRFRDRLTVRMAIDPASLTVLVPSIMLQPLVENSIRHGIAKSAAPGFVEISASKDGESLTIEIKDNGVGLNDAGADSQGFGLRNTRARLDQLYGDRHRFRLESAKGSGCRVTLNLPARAMGL